jgi:TIR domain
VQLEAAGYTTVLQAWDFRPGSNFVHQMQQATSSAGRTLAVVSPAYFESGFGEAEWQAAFVKDPTGERGLLVPVRVQPCEPPVLGRPATGHYRRMTYADGSEGVEEPGEVLGYFDAKGIKLPLDQDRKVRADNLTELEVARVFEGRAPRPLPRIAGPQGHAQAVRAAGGTTPARRPRPGQAGA